MRLFIQHHQILTLCIGMFLINASGIAVLFYWAIHSRQFSDQDHGRYLALEAYPEVKPDGDCRNTAMKTGSHERHGNRPDLPDSDYQETGRCFF